MNCKTQHTVFYMFFIIYLVSSTAAKAQKGYTQVDSARIYALLDKADEADNAGNLDQSINYTKQALIISRTVNMPRGEGFALLKLADLKLKKEGTENLVDLFDAPLKIGESLKDSF